MNNEFKLRGYQQEAVDAAISWVKNQTKPALLELATGAGKSFIVAAIADWLVRKSGKKVLCLAPSKELTEQNYAKYKLTGQPASYYSASLGKSLKANVIYGTPITVLNNIDRFGSQFTGVIIDEAHSTTNSIKKIINHIRQFNPYLRVIGMTATPYRMGSGYIYATDIDNRALTEGETKDPYYEKLLYSIEANFLISQGYLTRPNADPVLAHYDTGNLEIASTGRFTGASIQQAFEDKGRLTAVIVRDVIEHSYDRKGVMLFASTVQHAKEILESLPAGISDMLGGDVNMRKTERERLLKRFQDQQIKFLVSVGTLTTGFDATHVDLIAVLRPTESAGLFQQIIGRGLRLHPNKEDCLVLDYAENIERHNLQNNLFKPEIRVAGGGGSEILEVTCPDCSNANYFSARKNEDDYKVSKGGYFLDLAGQPIMTETPTGAKPMPAHWGRRCQFKDYSQPNFIKQCSYRWSVKECLDCEAENDIAARYCEKCKSELVDPNEKLTLDFQRVKTDTSKVTSDRVLSAKVEKHTAMSGRLTIKITYKTEYAEVMQWVYPERPTEWAKVCAAFFGDTAQVESIEDFCIYAEQVKPPKTISCYRPKGNKFWRVVAFNEPETTEFNFNESG